MQELSLHILDIAENAVAAKAAHIKIHLAEDGDGWLTLTVTDDGCGMDADAAAAVRDPFFTTRKTRTVGLGVPLLSLAAELCGGSLAVRSSTDAVRHGTSVTATFDTKHINAKPLGNMPDTVTAVLSALADADLEYPHETPRGSVRLSTKEMRAVLLDVPLQSAEVLSFAREYLTKQYEQFT